MRRKGHNRGDYLLTVKEKESEGCSTISSRDKELPLSTDLWIYPVEGVVSRTPGILPAGSAPRTGLQTMCQNITVDYCVKIFSAPTARLSTWVNCLVGALTILNTTQYQA